MRPITYMRVMRGEGLAGGSAETSLATARPFSSPHGSERHWSARQRLPRSKSQGGLMKPSGRIVRTTDWGVVVQGVLFWLLVVWLLAPLLGGGF